MIRLPPRSTLFPTRRSSDLYAAACALHVQRSGRAALLRVLLASGVGCVLLALLEAPALFGRLDYRERSEEHTSELQSQSNLVCRLLLEKKKAVYIRIRS